MAIEIREDDLNSGSLQSGIGVPTHLASTGTLFTDKSAGIIYINKNGSNLWSNVSTTGSTGGGGTITSFAYSPTNNTFSIVENSITYSATISIMSGLNITNTFISSGNTKLANSSTNKVLIGKTPAVGSYSGGNIVDGLTINSDSGGISFLRPTDYAQMVALTCTDIGTMRVGGGNQNSVDIHGHTTFISRFSNTGGGRVGILTTSPQFTLDVSGNTRITGGLTANTISATTITGSLNGTASLASNIASAVGTDNRILYQLSSNKTETSASLTWDGSKLVVKGDAEVTNTVSANGFSGRTNSISASKGSVITNGSPASAFINISGSDTIGGKDYVDFIGVTNTAVGATNITKTFRVNGTGDLEIIDDGYNNLIFSLTNAGVLYTPGGGTSDKRLKNNIEYISGDSSSIILQLKPAKFEFNKYAGIKRHGFIAQDVLNTTPELVLGDGEKEDGIYGLDYDGILALTVKSLQEALIKINDLEIKIKELNAK